jgi:uncharacterized protein YgbK (DUF1537 family)
MIGVVADDLSGAAEIGAIGVRHGLTAEIVCRGKPGGHAGLVCVDTHSRSCRPEEAAKRTAAAAKLLQEQGAEWIYKKVDSVLRGNVTAELEAMMHSLGVRRALLVPANPSRGRIVRRGRYHVDGRLIHLTEFGQDPDHPRLSSKIIEMLVPSATCAVQVVNVRDGLPPEGIIVGEATKGKDLELWAGRRLNRTALAGAAEFFAALLKAKGFLPGPDIVVKDEVLSNDRELFVSGTASASGRGFLRAARAGRTPIFSLPSELVWGAEFTEAAKQAVAKRVVAAFDQSSRVILNVGLPPLRDPAAARSLIVHLVQLAEKVLHDANVTFVYAEGGATAAALVQRMGWNRLEVLRELAPGVARLAAGENRSIFLTIKPGSYDWPQEVRKAVRSSRFQVLNPGAFPL